MTINRPGKKTWKNTRTQFERLDELLSKPDKNGCCKWLGGTFLEDGRPRVYNGKKTITLARVLLERKLKRKLLRGMMACHSCDNMWCCSLSHLWEGTARQNIDDMLSKNRQIKGTRSSQAKLTDAKVVAIRKSQLSQRKLAAEYGVSKSLVAMVKHEKIWRHVK